MALKVTLPLASFFCVSYFSSTRLPSSSVVTVYSSKLNSPSLMAWPLVVVFSPSRMTSPSDSYLLLKMHGTMVLFSASLSDSLVGVMYWPSLFARR